MQACKLGEEERQGCHLGLRGPQSWWSLHPKEAGEALLGRGAAGLCASACVLQPRDADHAVQQFLIGEAGRRVLEAQGCECIRSGPLKDQGGVEQGGGAEQGRLVLIHGLGSAADTVLKQLLAPLLSTVVVGRH